MEGELRCTRCDSGCHYKCILGCPVNNPRTQTFINKGNFRCPVCLVSRRDNLTIAAMQCNQQLHRVGQIDYELDPAAAGDVATVQQEDQVLEETEDTDNGVTVVPPPSPHRRRDQLDGAHPAAPGTPPPPSPHQERNDRQRQAGSVNGAAAEPHVDFIPIHSECEKKGKKFLSLMNNFLTTPKHANTLLLGDSLAHHVDKKDIDPDSDTLRIRSVGGLCVVAAVQALKRLGRSYSHIKRVIWCLGINDHLHKDKHCYEERSRYFKALQAETKRVFPNATVTFVVPYAGMKEFHHKDITELVKEVKLNCPKFKVLHPPSLKDMVDKKGVHPNKEGRRVYTNFFRSRFFGKSRLFSKDAGKRKPGTSYAQAHIHNIPHSTASGQAHSASGGAPSAETGGFPRPDSNPAYRGTGELENRFVDSIIRERLCEILLGQSVSQRTHRPSCQQYNY